MRNIIATRSNNEKATAPINSPPNARQMIIRAIIAMIIQAIKFWNFNAKIIAIATAINDIIAVAISCPWERTSLRQRQPREKIINPCGTKINVRRYPDFNIPITIIIEIIKISHLGTFGDSKVPPRPAPNIYTI